MSKQRLVDTNLIVRYLVQDHPQHAKAAEKLFDACDRGEVILIVAPVVLAECVFVLESFYRHARRDIGASLSSLLSSPGVEIDRPGIYLDALKRYSRTKIHFVDCVLAAAAAEGGIPVATFDLGFRKFADVRVEIE